MISPLTAQIGYAAMTGLAELFRQRNGARIQNTGEVRQIGGFAIDVAGENSRAETRTTTAFEPGRGARTYKPQPASGLLAPSTLSAALQTQGLNLDQDAFRAVRSGGGDPAFDGMVSIPETVEIVHTESVPVEQVQSVGYFPELLGRAEEVAYMRDQIDRLGKLADAERELSEEYGVQVKMAWDPVAEEYLALKPGQEGYDRVRSAQDLLASTKRDIGMMGHKAADFADLLAKYGVKV